MNRRIFPFNAHTAKPRGFTIVELLIVIVVIAIIATISIVSYTGIQDRANRVATTQALTQYVKALTLYRTLNGTYPVGGASEWRCLPDTNNNTGCGYMGTDPAPSSCSQLGAFKGVTDTTLNSQLQSVVSPIPKVSSQTALCGGQPYGGAFYAPFFEPTQSAALAAYFKGNIECPSVASLGDAGVQNATNKDDVTLCFWILQANN
jgi:prepilin-type N-terminal cleavage/methylation domain-containing protein